MNDWKEEVLKIRLNIIKEHRKTLSSIDCGNYSVKMLKKYFEPIKYKNNDYFGLLETVVKESSVNEMSEISLTLISFNESDIGVLYNLGSTRGILPTLQLIN